MKRVLIILEIVLWIGLIFLAGAGLYALRHGKLDNPRIIRETETVTKYVKEQPTDMSGFIAAWNSPLNITGVMRNDWIDVTATDGYKQADKSFQISVPDYKNMILAGAYGRIDRAGMLPGAYCMYYRFISRAGIGGGCMVDPSGIGFMAGAAWRW